MKTVILGAGAYGLALALSCYRNHHEVTIWTKIKSEKEELITYHENKKALPNVFIPEDITVTTDLSRLKNANIIIVAIPISFLKTTLLEIKEYVTDSMHFCIATKGIENDTCMLAHQILESIVKTNHISILSGPTFAIDLANLAPSGLTLAAKDKEEYEIISKCLENNTTMLEYSTDLKGTALCGSIKNIYAIISGLLEGMKQTETTKALFYQKAAIELAYLIETLGGKKETAYSLAGIGDLILTCTSNKSRNFTLGYYLATKSKEEINTYIKETTVEGYHTLLSIHKLCTQKEIILPLVNTIYDIIINQANKEKLLTILTSK